MPVLLPRSVVHKSLTGIDARAESVFRAYYGRDPDEESTLREWLPVLTSGDTLRFGDSVEFLVLSHAGRLCRVIAVYALAKSILRATDGSNFGVPQAVLSLCEAEFSGRPATHDVISRVDSSTERALSYIKHSELHPCRVYTVENRTATEAYRIGCSAQHLSSAQTRQLPDLSSIATRCQTLYSIRTKSSGAENDHMRYLERYRQVSDIYEALSKFEQGDDA